jgi:hypothetical protein
VAGECITHTGFTTRVEYRGKFVVQSCPSATEYIVLGTYGGTDTGFMKRAFSLRANAGSAGVYNVSASLTTQVATATTTFKVEMNQNITDRDNVAGERYHSTANKSYGGSISGFLTIADGDYIWLSIANLTDATDVGVMSLNLNLEKM